MIDEILMLVDFDSIKTLDSVMQLRTLKDIKNDMIGTAEAKQSYFDKGLIETVMPLLPTKDLDRNVRFEIFTVLNSFLFDCPRAVETLRLFEEQLCDAVNVAVAELALAQVPLPQSNHQSCFRFLGNLLRVKVLEPGGFEANGELLAKVVASTAQLSQVDASIAANLTYLLCDGSTVLATHFTQSGTLLQTFLTIVRDLSTQVSEEYLGHCLRAIAALTKKSVPIAIGILMAPEHAVTLQMIAKDLQRYPQETFQVACASIVANCASGSTSPAEFSKRIGSPNLLRWTLTSIVGLVPAAAQASSKDTQVIKLVQSATLLCLGNQQMQKVAHELHFQEKLAVLMKSKQVNDGAWGDVEMALNAAAYKDRGYDAELKEAIVVCFAALVEKLEDARTDFVMNRQAMLGLVEVVGSEPKLTRLQLAAFDLLRSLGRAKLSKKKILREKFTERKINFVHRVTKQLLHLESGENTDLVRKMRLITIRVINNFGIDFKQFVYREELMEKLVEIVNDPESHGVEKRDAIMTLKNLCFGASEAEQAEIEKKVTGEFVLRVLRNSPQLRDQALLLVKMKLQQLEQPSSQSYKQGLTKSATDQISFLDSEVKVDQFFGLLTQICTEAHDKLMTYELKVEEEITEEFCQAQCLFLVANLVFFEQFESKVVQFWRETKLAERYLFAEKVPRSVIFKQALVHLISCMAEASTIAKPSKEEESKEDQPSSMDDLYLTFFAETNLFDGLKKFKARENEESVRDEIKISLTLMKAKLAKAKKMKTAAGERGKVAVAVGAQEQQIDTTDEQK